MRCYIDIISDKLRRFCYVFFHHFLPHIIMILLIVIWYVYKSVLRVSLVDESCGSSKNLCARLKRWITSKLTFYRILAGIRTRIYTHNSVRKMTTLWSRFAKSVNGNQMLFALNIGNIRIKIIKLLKVLSK